MLNVSPKTCMKTMKKVKGRLTPYKRELGEQINPGFVREEIKFLENRISPEIEFGGKSIQL